MTDSEFNDRIDNVMMALEDAIEDSGCDIDCENSGGILTLSFDNGSHIILSRQSATRQLWVAAKSGGFHMDFNEEREEWRCGSNGESLSTLLSRCIADQAEEDFKLTL